MSLPKISSINTIVAVPLIVMSYHMYGFFAGDPAVLRFALAASFDLMVVAVFYLLKDEHIKKNKRALQMTWIALYVLIAFQLYVNVWAYWELNYFRAFMSGSILPISVGLITYISMMREEHQEEAKRKRALKKQSLQLESSSLEQSKDAWEGERVSKQEARSAFLADTGEENKRQFSKASNYRSVTRWWQKWQDSNNK